MPWGGKGGKGGKGAYGPWGKGLRPFEQQQEPNNPNNDGLYACQQPAGSDQWQRLEFYSLTAADSIDGEAPVASGVTFTGTVRESEELSSQEGFRAPRPRQIAKMPRMPKDAKVTTVHLNKFLALDDGEEGQELRTGGGGNTTNNKTTPQHNPHLYTYGIPHQATAAVYPDTGLARCRDNNPGETERRGMQDLSGSGGTLPHKAGPMPGVLPTVLCRQDISTTHSKMRGLPRPRG